MCSIKVFIPVTIYNQEYKDNASSYLYGHIRQATDHSPITFYVLERRSIKENHPAGNIPIGEITNEGVRRSRDYYKQHKQFICFKTNILHQNILLVDIQCTEQENEANPPPSRVQIVLFDLNSFQKSTILNDLTLGTSNHTKDDIEMLQTLLYDSKARNGIILQTINTLAYTLGSNRIVAGICYCCANVLSQRVMRDTAVARHFTRWRRTFIVEPLTMCKLWSLLFDVFVGIVIMLSLLHYERSHTFMIHSTELIVENLRYLLDELKGFPVGFKLNVELNNFFSSIFTYHIDLWATFLVTISPIIKYLCIPLAVLGCFGLSFQLAMLCDLLVLVTLHGHCFYVYIAVLYRIELVGIQALWNVLLGRNRNALKDRIESYEYTNSQLYLATIFFTAMLFLFPTIAFNYMVFASLRFGVYCITYILIWLQFRIINFPILNLFCWIHGSFINPNSAEISFLKLQMVKTKECLCLVTILQIEMKASSLSDVIPSTKFSETMPTVGKFLEGLVKGEMMGFIQPLTTYTSI